MARGAGRGRASDRLKVAVAQAEPRDEGERPGVQAERREQGATVREAVRKLPDAQREAVVMAYWGDLTADEIARRIESRSAPRRAGSGSAWRSSARTPGQDSPLHTV